MRILIDECLPKKLKLDLTDHFVQTVPDAGWAGKQNGELLRLAELDFDDSGMVRQRHIPNPSGDRRPDTQQA